MSNSDSVLLSADRDIVPDRGPLADHDVSDEGCIGGDPGVRHVRHAVVQWHHLTVARGLVQEGNVIGELASNAIKF